MNDNVYFSTNPDPGQDNKPLDWRTLDVSTPEGLRALDKIVAQRLGYTVHVSEPHGRVCAQRFAPSGAWEKSYFTPEYKDPEMAAWQNVPHYSTDANAALTLKAKDPWLTHVEYAPQLWALQQITGEAEWHALFADELPEDIHEGYTAPTPALAVCKAWLAYGDENTDAAAPGTGEAPASEPGNGGGE